ncbi:MAG TPA: hypothetical protein VMT46_16250 [Anaerolineaceae bacterium]|nr:hypothetical protein [Anaerolineaceae bacterium]
MQCSGGKVIETRTETKEKDVSGDIFKETLEMQLTFDPGNGE